ncbi:MAG TPA: hypothetical protein VII94_01255, partial [Candidatus Saccharimonadales bacterium]
AGLPGDIISSVKGLANYGISKLTGNPGLIPDIPLPTSEAIRRNVTKPLTGEYLEPRGSGEDFYDKIIGDAATLLIPLKTKIPFSKAIGGALGRSLAGNTAQWAAEKVTDSPLVGAGVKIGAMALAGTIGGRKELVILKDKSYKDAFSKLPEKTKFDFKPEIQKLEKIANKFLKGDHPDKKFILDRLNSIENVATESGKSAIKDMIDLKQDWNKYLSDPSLSKSSRDSIKQAVGIVNDGIKRYGTKNPAFFKPYQAAEELTGALQSTNYVQKVLAKHPYLQQSVKNPIINKLLWGGAIYSAGHAGFPAIAGLGAGALIAKESAKAYQLLAKSPIAQRYYKDLIEAALRNDTKAIAKNLSKLDKSADNFEFANEDESSGRYEFVD